jgi:hypothetical protein
VASDHIKLVRSWVGAGLSMLLGGLGFLAVRTQEREPAWWLLPVGMLFAGIGLLILVVLGGRWIWPKLPPVRAWRRAASEVQAMNQKGRGGGPSRAETMHRSKAHVNQSRSADGFSYGRGDPVTLAEARRQRQQEYGLPEWRPGHASYDTAKGLWLSLEGLKERAGWHCELRARGHGGDLCAATWTDVEMGRATEPARCRLAIRFPDDFQEGNCRLPLPDGDYTVRWTVLGPPRLITGGAWTDDYEMMAIDRFRIEGGQLAS